MRHTIDWHEERFLVTSPKTEYHQGNESRVVPLFPELAEILNEGCEADYLQLRDEHFDRASAEDPATTESDQQSHPSKKTPSVAPQSCKVAGNGEAGK